MGPRHPTNKQGMHVSPCEAVLEKVDLQGVEGRHQCVDAQVKLVVVDEERVLDVPAARKQCEVHVLERMQW